MPGRVDQAQAQPLTSGSQASSGSVESGVNADLKSTITSLAGIAAAVLLGVGLAAAGSQHGVRVGGVPAFAIAVVLAFVVQWLAFVPAYVLQTERFYDLMGSLTFITVTGMLVAVTPGVDARGLLAAALVVIWAVRLGSFLFARVSRAGADDRFAEIKVSLPRFLLVWTMQGLWVSSTAAAAWIAISSINRVALDAFALVGLLIWAVGFGIEVAADRQKSRFRADPGNRGRFIASGLWSRSRHPNYFGEIVLWLGMALLALPAFTGWQWVGLISPVFVTVLLTRISGIPLLEVRADAKWGGQSDYEDYKRRTPVLIPRLGR